MNLRDRITKLKTLNVEQHQLYYKQQQTQKALFCWSFKLHVLQHLTIRQNVLIKNDKSVFLNVLLYFGSQRKTNATP